MGPADRMKRANKSTNFKLSKEEREGLEETAIELALNSVKTLLGHEPKATYQDMQARVAYHVRNTKMQWCGSGMTEIVTPDQMRHMFEHGDDEEEPVV